MEMSVTRMIGTILVSRQEDEMIGMGMKDRE